MSHKRFWIIFGTTFVADLIVAAYMLGLSHARVALAVGSALILPWCYLYEQALFADAPTLRDRLWITLATALGSAVGTVVIMSAFYQVMSCLQTN